MLYIGLPTRSLFVRFIQRPRMTLISSPERDPESILPESGYGSLFVLSFLRPRALILFREDSLDDDISLRLRFPRFDVSSSSSSPPPPPPPRSSSRAALP